MRYCCVGLGQPFANPTLRIKWSRDSTMTKHKATDQAAANSEPILQPTHLNEASVEAGTMETTGPSFQSHPEHADAVSQALEAIQQLVAEHPDLLEPLRTASSTDDVRQMLRHHGIEISSEALWRHRGMLLKDGQPTWRG